MRCSKCGKKNKKKSSFCVKCGAKLPPVPKKDKKAKGEKGKKKRSKGRILILLLILLILGMLVFLLFGGDRVPEKIRNIKGYSHVTAMVQDKMPDKLKLPFDLPFDLPDKLPFSLPEKLHFDFSFKLPFELPNPGKLLGDSEVPDKEKIMEDLAAYEGEEESEMEFDSLEIEKRITVEKEKTDTVYVITETNGEKEGETRSNYYRLHYKRHLIGGWKLDKVEPYNVEGQKTSVAGVDNETVIRDDKVFSDIGSNWKHSNVKVLEHYTDVKTGTDVVSVYMELENEYVNMTGIKEILYQYNDETKQWEAIHVSKLTALSIEPVSLPAASQ